MKNFILATALLIFVNLIVYNSVNAQPKKIYPMSVGAYINGKVGVNAAEVPNGVKNGVLVLNGVDFGAVGYFPFSKTSNTAGLLEIGYSSFPFKLAAAGNSSIESDIKMNYVTVSPQIYFSGFTIGCDLGFHASTEIKNNKFEFEDEVGEFMLNIKLGGMIPIWVTETGRINLLLKGIYAITGSSYGIGEDFEFHPASLGIGLNYLFNLK